MIYLQLERNYKDYDKLRVKSVNFTQDPHKRLSFDYQIYKNNEDSIEELFSKMLVITDESLINQFENFSDPNLNIWDELCIQIINYIIDKGIESGTIESE